MPMDGQIHTDGSTRPAALPYGHTAGEALLPIAEAVSVNKGPKITGVVVESLVLFHHK